MVIGCDRLLEGVAGIEGTEGHCVGSGDGGHGVGAIGRGSCL